jgi:hypothetical protein
MIIERRLSRRFRRQTASAPQTVQFKTTSVHLKDRWTATASTLFELPPDDQANSATMKIRTSRLGALSSTTSCYRCSSPRSWLFQAGHPRSNTAMIIGSSEVCGSHPLGASSWRACQTAFPRPDISTPCSSNASSPTIALSHSNLLCQSANALARWRMK